MIVFIYFIVPCAVAVLWFLSKDIEDLQEIKEKGISRQLYRISLFVYRTLMKQKRLTQTHKIREFIKSLGTEKGLELAEEKYYAQKISIVILISLCGSFLALLLFISNKNAGEIRDGFYISRNLPGKGEKRLELVANDSEGNPLGEFEVCVDEMVYTRKEQNNLFEKASAEMESLVLGDNESLDYVTENLNLEKKIEGYPFEISWKNDNLDVLSYSGELQKDNIPKEGVIVTLYATYKYDGNSWEQVLYARIMPQLLTKAEIVFRQISDLLSANAENTKYEEDMLLPKNCEESEIIWHEKIEDDSLLLLIITLIGAALTFVLKDKELKRKADERNKILEYEYPKLVSQLALYLGAGMTMRNIFFKLSENYTAKKKSGSSENYMYEEILRTTRELSAGKSEAEAYEGLGYRCKGQQYTRLSTLLSQNLRKGNSELLTLLNEETKRSFAERLERVRKEGEEAGTKLLLPMILMLLIVMIIIMIPAYMTF